MHVRNQDGFSLLRGSSTDALSERNANAGRLPLERAEHQLVAAQYVNPGPVNAFQVVVHERDKIRGIRQGIRLAVHERLGLICK
jgi:hypothetical protein